ncbi:MAG TPA: ABC transporter permease [Gammaproteobacteria bacterium]|nr:ABC transporter permease [Gammaproteobacteria bacterium]
MLTSGWLDVLGRDLKFTRRVLTKNFAFTATAIVTLALGVAASTVIYSVVDAVLLQPLAYRDSGDIYRVYTVDPAGLPRGTTGPPHIDPMADEGEQIQAAMYGYSFEQSVVNGEGTSFALNEFRTSQGFFKVFTEPMHLGRSFEPSDNYQDTILSHQTWRDVYGSDPDIIGRPINVGSGPLTVIGVAAEGFEFPVGTGMWTLIYTARDAGQNRPFPLFNMPGYVRAAPGVSAGQVQAELDVFAGRLSESFPWPDGRPLEFVSQPLLHEVVGDLRGTLFIVSGATAVLLLIACINVANLLLARGVVRTSEFALREAIGARRWRVFRQLMTESFVLCTLGGILGLGLALGAIQLLKAIGPADLPRLSTVSIDTNVFLFAAGCVVLVALLVGFAPALRVARGDLSALLNAGGRSAAMARGRNRIFGALVVAEIALAVVLVIGAGLLVRSYSQIASTDPGFDPRRMLTLVLNVTGRTDIRNMRPDQERRRLVYDGSGLLGVTQFYEELLRRIEALPGVASAGTTSAAPLNQGLFPVVLGAFPVIGSSIPVTEHRAYVSQVSPEYFTTLGIRPLAGRLLEPTDRRGGAGAVVINEAYARAYIDGDPLGRRVALPGGARPGGLAFNQLGEQTLDDGEIVGVVPDIKQATLEDDVQPALFVPQQQWHVRKMAVVVRAEHDDPAALIPAIRRELEAMDSTLPGVFAVYTDIVAAGLSRHRLGALVLIVFGFVSLTLAAVGTYGLMSFSVNQRVNEIAVRSAFGAERGKLLAMFVSRALQLGAIGIVLGVAGAVAMRQLVASQLYETSALDPWVLVLVPLTMAAVTMVASYVPARRASRIDVSAALREN